MNLPNDLVIAGRLPEGWTQGKSAFITIDKVSSKETGLTSREFKAWGLKEYFAFTRYPLALGFSFKEQGGGRFYRRFTPLYSEILTTAALTTIQINAFGNNSVLMLEKLRSLLQSSFAQEKLKKIKVGIVTMSDVKDITTPFAAGYEERANLDLIVSHKIITTIPLANIEHQGVDIHYS